MLKLQKYSPFDFTIFCAFYVITRYQRGRANCIRVWMGRLFWFQEDMFVWCTITLSTGLNGVVSKKKHCSVAFYNEASKRVFFFDALFWKPGCIKWLWWNMWFYCQPYWSIFSNGKSVHYAHIFVLFVWCVFSYAFWLFVYMNVILV